MSITRDDVLTVSDVAALLDLKPYTVKEYARRGILPGRKLDGPGGSFVLSLKRPSDTCRERTKRRGNDTGRRYDHPCDHARNNHAAVHRRSSHHGPAVHAARVRDLPPDAPLDVARVGPPQGRSAAGHSAPVSRTAGDRPVVGFAEAFVLGALRQAGVPMQRIRPAVRKLNDEIGLDHALASRRVYTDGAELIFDYASSSDDEALLTVVRTGQEHLADVIRGYLKRITYGDDGWAERLRLPAYTQAEVTVDPTEAFGQPVVVHGGARVEDLVDRFKAGDGFAEIAADFDVPSAEVEDVIRVALRLPA